jgi:disulfide bond formation protein DsbB
MNRSGLLLAASAAAAAAGVVFALYATHAWGMRPCPLCILQRMLFVAFALAAAAGALRGARPLAALAGVIALTGAGVASYHLWIEANPLQAACGLAENEPWWESFAYWAGEQVPYLFNPSGDCAAAYKLLGVSFAAWSLALFVALLLASAAALGAARPRRR